jgi:hypothetical protein
MSVAISDPSELDSYQNRSSIAQSLSTSNDRLSPHKFLIIFP